MAHQPHPKLDAHHEAALKAAGINWQNIPWTQLVSVIQALLAALAAHQAAQQAAPPTGKNPPTTP